MLNPIFSKKVQGQKHPGRWGIVEHQIHSIKVLFKTNTKGHKHPSIRLISRSKTQLVNQRKQKVAFSPGTAHSPEIQSYRMWWGAASPMLNTITQKPIENLINTRRHMYRPLNPTQYIRITNCIAMGNLGPLLLTYHQKSHEKDTCGQL